MTFSLTFKCDNAAFQDDDDEIVRILRDLANRLEPGISNPDAGAIHDANGNRVGSWTLS